MGDKNDQRPGLEKAQRDIVMLGIATAAILLFVGIGGTVMPQVVRHLVSGNAAPPDTALTNALLLNIALIIFGWRRYSDLRQEIEQRIDPRRPQPRWRSFPRRWACRRRSR